MALPPRPRSTSVLPRATGAAAGIFAIGQRAMVHGGPGSRGAPLTSDDGSTVIGTLPEGAEVDIVAWRPRGAGGTRYRVRSSGASLEGWVGSANLAARPPPLPPPPPPNPEPARAKSTVERAPAAARAPVAGRVPAAARPAVARAAVATKKRGR